eukprot:1145393-Alexandrium_andersonii.AAC.1
MSHTAPHVLRSDCSTVIGIPSTGTQHKGGRPFRRYATTRTPTGKAIWITKQNGPKPATLHGPLRGPQ